MTKRLEEYSGEETERRTREAIRRSVETPHKPQKEMVGKVGRPWKRSIMKSEFQVLGGFRIGISSKSDRGYVIRYGAIRTLHSAVRSTRASNGTMTRSFAI
jgi:hypothetical protein